MIQVVDTMNIALEWNFKIAIIQKTSGVKRDYTSTKKSDLISLLYSQVTYKE